MFRKSKMLYIVLCILIFGSQNIVMALNQTFSLTLREIHTWGNSGLNSGKVGGTPARPATINVDYAYETLMYNALSGLSDVSIDNCTLRVNLTHVDASSAGKTASIYPQNKGNFNTTAVWSTYANTAWTSSLGSITTSSNGWSEIKGTSLNNLVQSWVTTPANNQGFVMGGNFGAWGAWWEFTEAVLVVYYHLLNTAPTDIALSNSSINENAGSNATVGTLSTTDPDAGQSFTYSLVPSSSVFNISSNLLRATNSLNYEAQISYTLTIRTTDNGTPNLSYDKSFTITVNNVNESPSDMALSASSVAENAVTGTTIGTLSTTEPDASQSHIYTLVSGTGSTDNARFQITGSTLQTNYVFDYESQTSASIRVRTTDNGSPAQYYEEAFTISITNVNEAPMDLALSSSAVNENTATGTAVGTLSTTEPDASQSHTYTLVTGSGDTDNGRFQISGTTLQTNYVFNYETQSSASIRIRTTDNGSPNLYYEESVTVNITNINESPTDIALSNASVNENAGANAVVGTLSSTDPDTGQTFTYSLVTGSSAFNLSGSTLRATNSLNYETQSSYSVTIRTTDNGTPNLYFDEQFTITVINVNDIPTNITLSDTSIFELLPSGTSIGTFTSTDQDATDTHVYTLVSGTGDTGNGSFTIPGNTLQSAAVFDFDVQSTFSIRVRTTDNGTPNQSFDEIFTIVVKEVNVTPTNITLTQSVIDENAASGTVVGTLSTTDANLIDSHTYSIIAGATTSFSINGTQLRTAAVFNYEAQSSYQITIRTTDAGGLTYDKPFTISVNNLNETPTNITISSTNVLENVPVGTLVGVMSPADQDIGQAHTFSLVSGTGGTDNAGFAIRNDSLFTNAIFNFEAGASKSIRLRTTDNGTGNLYFEKAFTITIVNQNDTPIDIALSNASQAENSAIGTSIGVFTTSDPDAGDAHTYSLVAGAGDTDNGKFGITAVTLQNTALLDFETQSSYTIRVRTTDGTGAYYEEAFTIAVTNANDAPTNITLVKDSVAENLAPGASVGVLSATDQDAGATHTFSFLVGTTSNDNDSFSIVSGNSLITKKMLDYEKTPVLYIYVRANDGNGGIYDKTIPVHVIDQHIAPVITMLLPNDTIIPTDSVLTLTATATGEPGPYYTWYHWHPDSAVADSVGSGPILTLAKTSKADSGYFYFISYNLMGSDTSDTLLVNIAKSVEITYDIPSTYQAVHGSSVALSLNVAGDGVISYQWYEDNKVFAGQTGKTLTIPKIDSTIHNGKIYHCEVWNTYKGKLLKSVTSTHCRIIVGALYNPFRVKAERVSLSDNTQVRLKIWSDIDISGFPSSSSIKPWADSLWVFHQTNGYPATPAGAVATMISTEEIKTAVAAKDSLKKVISVAALVQPHDSCYWFSNSVLWRVPGGTDTLLRPLVQSNKVFMLDTVAPTNPLVLHGSYVMKTDTALLYIDSIPKLDALRDSMVIVECSKFPAFSPLMYSNLLGVQALLAQGQSSTLIIDNVGILPLELDTIFCRWRIVGTNGATGANADTSFTIGWPRPEYTGTFRADSTQLGGEIRIQWDPPSAVDSIRVWWDNDTLPLDHTFQLPVTQSKNLDTLATTDMILGLDNDAHYCLGLQVFKDDLWSRLSPNSRVWAKTALGDTSMVENIVKIDSSRFDIISNSLIVNWHIDTLQAPGGRTYEAGYVIGFDSISIGNAAQTVLGWDSVYQKVNRMVIPLSNAGIVFDTSYYLGIWLRGKSVNLGAGKKSPPTSDSKTKIKSPPFSWQVITFFPTITDTVWLANHKIVLKKINSFTITDTIKSFDPGLLPIGFVNVGGVSFTFCIDNPQVPDFIIGLKYGQLPVGVTLDKIGLYQYINGMFYVRHGFTISSGMVWDTISNTDMKYPFLILADLQPPVITDLDMNNDTITPGATIPTYFTIGDNIANVYWKFSYGPGHEKYSLHEQGYCDTTYNPLLKAFIRDTMSVISESFGVRAQLFISDGVNRDTINVSRSVRTLKGEDISLVPQEWTPLRSTMQLTDQSLSGIFDMATSGPGTWKYDVYNYRLYSWNNLDSAAENDWVEYADSISTLFNLVPGRLVWCKTAEPQSISVAGGITTSLKQPYDIVLKPNNWTDICSPYRFPIMLRDVLEENQSIVDSLEVYHWVKNLKGYDAIDVFVPPLDSVVNEIDTLKSEPKNDGYTIFNHCSTAVVLHIPPVCLPLSRYSQPVARETVKNSDFWAINLMWKEENGDNSAPFRRIRCGYRKNSLNTVRYGSLPPSMGSVRVGVYNRDAKRLCGWAVQPEMEKGGVAYEIKFENSSDKRTRINYYLGNLGVLPKGIGARLLNPATQRFDDCSINNMAEIKVDAMSQINRIIVVGTAEYLQNVAKSYLPLKLVKAFPNPFKGQLRIQYRIPVGIDEIQLSLYNLRGQMLWKAVQRKDLNPGEHVYYFDGVTGVTQGAISSGLYILRLTARNKDGKALYGGRKRVTCIK